MKLRGLILRSLILTGLCALACLAAACHRAGLHKKLSPEGARQTRLDWNMKTLVGAYNDVGNTDDRWDEAATNALTAFARSRADMVIDDSWQNSIATNCDTAIKAGCDDPMIRYLHLRFPVKQVTPKEYADALCKVEADMQQSHYPPVRKFYAALRAAEQVTSIYPRDENGRRLRNELADNLVENLAKMATDKTAPAEEIYQASEAGLKRMTGSTEWYERCYGGIETAITTNWPDDAVTWLLKGEVEVQRAWLARGGGYANNVTADGWKSFAGHLANAEPLLKKAWELDPKDDRIPIQMIRVAEGRQQSRPDMELWFDRAMAANPNSYDACEQKLHYLYPQWYGSREAMIEFGRQCVASTNWGGEVPLILSEAHWEYWRFLEDSDYKTNYWKDPEVWPDIQSSFERFFELNPNASGYYYKYAWYAYRCEQWDKLNELISKLGNVDYSYFGGKDEFDKMVELAKQHGKSN